MKKIILLMVGIIPFLLASCVVNKTALRTAYNTPPTDEQKYFGTNSLSSEAALAMIGTFPKHKYRGWRKAKVDSAWSLVDVAQLKNIVNDSNVDSMKIFLAVEINPDDKSTFLVPTVVIQVNLKESNTSMSKGSNFAIAQTQYLSSPQICPPPRGECRVQP